MAWIETHQSLLTHRKTLRLTRLLGLDRFAVVGRLVAMWCWALDNAPDGWIEDADADALAEVMGWQDDPAALLAALAQAGFLDAGDAGTHHLHDWDDYAGKLLDRRKANAERQKSWRNRHKDDTDQDSNSYVTVTLPSRNGATVPNSTVPNHRVTKGKVILSSLHAAADADGVEAEANPPTTTATPRTTTRKGTPNPHWDALVQALGFAPTTEREKRIWGKAVHDLKAANASADDIGHRAARYIERYGADRLTVNALVTHWSECDPARPTPATKPKPTLRAAPEPPAFDLYKPPAAAAANFK